MLHSTEGPPMRLRVRRRRAPRDPRAGRAVAIERGVPVLRFRSEAEVGAMIAELRAVLERDPELLARKIAERLREPPQSW